MSALAKSMGCQRVVALINRRAYADLVQGGRSILSFPRRWFRSAICSRTYAAALWSKCIAFAGVPPKRASLSYMVTRKARGLSANGLAICR